MKNPFKKIFSKIRAVFDVEGVGYAVELKQAEIKPNQICLHPIGQKNTFVIRNKDVDILINNGESISKNDFFIMDISAQRDVNEASNEAQIAIEETPRKKSAIHHTTNDATPISPYFLKKKITFTFYGDEFEWVNNAIENSGMRRADYILACLQNAQKQSSTKRFSAELERITKQRDKHIQEVKDYYKSR